MKDKIIIFGIGRKLVEYKFRGGVLNNINIIAYCDNDNSKTGKMYDGIEAIPPSKLVEYDYDKILISTEQYYEEIKKNLVNEYGIPAYKIGHIDVLKNKYEGELGYWKMVYHEEGNRFSNDFYREKMLKLADEKDDSFWKDKVVVDFGCGPRGTLTWTSTPLIKLGVDVLAGEYLRCFGKEIVNQDMIYVTSSEEYIPIPNNFADYLITINSLDHVEHLSKITEELLRILKKDGILLGSFNLNEDITECEPQTLDEDILNGMLLKNFKIIKYEVCPTGKKNKNGVEQSTLYVKAQKL